MHRLLSLSIRSQILIICLIVAIPAAGIIFYSGVTMREQALADARLQTLQLAETIASEQQNLMTSAQQAIITLAQLPEVKKQNAAQVQPILRDILRLNAQFSNIFMADRNGRVWASAVPQLLGQTIVDRRYFKNALAHGQLSSGEYVISRATTKPAFNVADSLKNEHGETIGVISVGFKLDAYRRILDRAKLPADTSFILLDHRGMVLYRAIKPEEYIGRQYDETLFRQMQEGPDMQTYDNVPTISGDVRVLTYRKLRLPGEESPYLYIRAGIPMTTVLAGANKTLVRNMSLFTLFIILAVSFAWIIGKRSIVDRVALLENASRRLAAGDLHVRISDIVSGGELGRLGETFDTMASRLSLREAALIDSERNYHEIFDTTRDAIFVHDAESGDILDLNSTVKTMFGYDREELLHRTVEAISAGEAPYTAAEAARWIRRAMQEGPQSFEWHSKKKNGERFWTDVVLSMTNIGGTGRVLAVVRDITPRKQAEESLRERDELLRQAVRVSQFGIFDHNQRSETIYWSPRQRVIYGWGPDEPVTLPAFIDRIHPDDRGYIGETVQRAHDPTGDGIWDVEHRIIRRDGAVRWLKARSQTFFEGEGATRRPVRTVGITLDITERKQIEEEQQKLVSVIEMSRDFISIAGVKGNILYVNSAGMSLVGIDGVDECRSKSIPDFLGEADQGLLEAEILPSLFRSGTWIGELALRHFKTGRMIPVDMSAFAIKDTKSGTVIALANISRDISERRHAEEEKQKLQAQLLQVQKMESVGQLAGGIAHDFNNILAAIIGYGSIMRQKIPTENPIREHLDQILAAAERASGLTQSLLAFSRKQLISPKHIDLNESIRKTERFLSRIIGEDIALTTSLAAGDLTVFVDPSQFEQVLLNLATNARDAMPNGGTLLIETRRVELGGPQAAARGFREPGPYALLGVRDSGTGMDAATKDKIFEPFFSTKEVGKGTGLGLSIVYGIVEQNNGHIEVSSEPGKGTGFRIYLPLVVRASEDRQRPEVPLAVRGGTETILLAEDDEAVRKLTRSALSEVGYAVIEATDGEDALQKFREHRGRISLIMLDVIMPKKNGSVVYEHVRSMEPGVKVIFTSGYPADLVEKEGVLEQKFHFLPKPATPEEIVKKVRSVLDEK